MRRWLTQYLAEYVSGFGVFQYLTLRTMVSVVTALAVSLLIGPRMISWLTRSQIGQQVRDDGPAILLIFSLLFFNNSSIQINAFLASFNNFLPFG